MAEDFDDHFEEVGQQALADPAVCVAPETDSNDIPAVSAGVREDVLAVGRKPLKVDLAVPDSYIQELVPICAQKGVCSINRKWLADNDTKFYCWLLKRMTKRRGQKNLNPLWYRLRKLLAAHNIVLDLNLPVSEQKREQGGVHNVARALLGANLPKWIPDTLKAVACTDYIYFTGKYNTPHGIRWSCLVRQLPQQLQSLFVYPKYNEALFEHYPEEKALYVRGRRSALQRDLKKALTEKNPPSFDAAWMEANVGYTYRSIWELAQIDEGFSWWGFIKEMGDGWIAKYKRKFSFKDESTLEGNELEEYREHKDSYLRRRKVELQGQAKTLLEAEKPESFSPAWIQAKNRSLYHEILRLMKANSELNWYDFIEEIGEEWLVKFDFKCKSLGDYARKLVILVKAAGIETWSLRWLRDKHNIFLTCIQRQLKIDGKTAEDWNEFLARISPELLAIYEDEASVKAAAKEKHTRLAIESAAGKLTAAVVQNGLTTWTLNDIAGIDPIAHRAVTKNNGVSVGIKRCLPLLPDDVLLGARSNVPMMKYVFWAERIRRSIDCNGRNGWRIRDIKDELLKAELGQLNGEMSVLLSFLPPELSFGFIPYGAVNTSRARVVNVLSLGSDEPGRVHEILEESGYLESGRVNIQLLISLRNEIQIGNKYAVTVAESILENYLSQQNINTPIKRGSVAEILFTLNERDDFYMQIIRIAYGLGRDDKTISLDQ